MNAKQVPTIAAMAVVLSVMGAYSGHAGLNSAAVAGMYWQAGSTGSAIATRDDTSGTCQLVVTCKGVSSFRGADVQIMLAALDGGPFPPAWQGQPGGCAEDFILGYVGGRGGTGFPNVFTAAPALSGTVVTSNQEWYATGDCRTPHGWATLIMSAMGATGGTRTSTKEYAIWAVSFDLASSVDPADLITPCAGGASDPGGPRGICLFPELRTPCSGPNYGGAVRVFDENAAEDVIPFVAGRFTLTWNAGSLGQNCPPYFSAKPTTWGGVKRMYR